MRTSVFAGCLSLVAVAASAQPTASFTLMTRQAPISRLEAPMAYDSVNQRIVVFGGYDHNYNRYNEVWEYEPVLQTWRNVTPSSGPQPQPRQGSTIAYDSVRQKIVLFGGQNDALQFLGDTWVWDCNARTWTEVATGGTPGTHKPTPRYGVAMVYDPSRDRMVLHGGIDQNRFYGDTWLFDPGALAWSQLATTTSSSNGRVLLARGYHAMTISSGTSPDNRVFLFGGEGFEGNPPQLPVLAFEDLWELVGSTWTDRTPSGVAAGNNGACSNAAACPGKAGWRPLAFDPAGNRLVTQGGWTLTGNLQATRAFSLATNTWSLVSNTIGGVTNLSTRDSHAMVAAPVANKLILFGGYLADVWELSGTTWTSPPAWDPRTSILPAAYPRQDYHALAWDSTRNQVVAISGGSAETWRLSAATWQPTATNVGGFTERVGHAAAYAPAPVDRVLMFGGRCKSIGAFTGGNCGAGGTLFNDLRAFNPATGAWSALAPSGGPPPARWDHTFVYDAANQRFVLYGGRNAAGLPFGDTWLLQCTGPATCAWSAGPAGPPNRYGHGMTYDAVRQRVVLFGGDSGVGPYGDTWEWNGSAWSNLTPGGGSPSARVHPALAPLSTLAGGVLLFGGRDGAPRDDAWIWNGTQWQQALIGGAAPRARENAEAVFAASVGRIFIQGGFDASGLMVGDAALATRFAKGDFDQTDTTDLVLRSPSTPNPVLWNMNGVNRVSEQTADAGLLANEQVVGVDDFGFDGRNDLVVWNSATGAVTFWFMNGPTRFGTAALTGAAPLATDWKVAATADFSHDGKPDILFRNSLTQKLTVWTLNSTARTGVLTPNPDQAVDANWEVVGALDYNSDGNTDLLWYNPFSGKIVFWYLDFNLVRTTGFFANPANAGNNNWKVLAAGDYGTGGGQAGTKDLVWRNADSGRFVVWYMDNAGNRLSGVFTNPLEPSPNPTLWSIVGPK
jgi:hypothetical protein